LRTARCSLITSGPILVTSVARRALGTVRKILVPMGMAAASIDLDKTKTKTKRLTQSPPLPAAGPPQMIAPVVSLTTDSASSYAFVGFALVRGCFVRGTKD
jgi:hypothetical protein